MELTLFHEVYCTGASLLALRNSVNPLSSREPPFLWCCVTHLQKRFCLIVGTVQWSLIARSALYVRRVVKTRCSVCPSVRPSVRSSVRSSVRPSVRSENNYFLRVAYEGWTHLCGQWGFENPILKKLKKKCQSVLSLANLSLLDLLLDTFFELLKKQVPDVDCVSWQKVEDFRKVGVVDSAKFAILGDSRSCRARCI